MTDTSPRGTTPRAFAKWAAVIVATAGFATIAIRLGPTDGDVDSLPPELADEPEMYIEGSTITVFRDDGTLRYRLKAALIRHYEQPPRSTLQEPVLELHTADPAPWRLQSQTGVVRRVSDRAEGDQEQIDLHGDVTVTRDRGGDGYTRIRTDSITVFPGSQQARTKQTAMIETGTVSARVGGFEADLAAGRLAFSSSTETRVSVVVQPNQQVTPRR